MTKTYYAMILNQAMTANRGQRSGLDNIFQGLKVLTPVTVILKYSFCDIEPLKGCDA